MPIVKDEVHERDYVVMHNRVLEDESLSWEARGVLAYLLSRPDNWQPSVAHICKLGNMGRGKGQRIFNELKEAGYVKKSVPRGTKGQVAGQVLTCYETPRSDQEAKQQPNVVCMSGYTKTPLSDNPSDGKAVLRKSGPLISTDKEISTDSNNTSSSDDDGAFEKFWSMWPKKVGKVAAVKAWKKVKDKPATLSLILINLEMHANAGDWKDVQYIPNPATYINQERWTDQVYENSGSNSKYSHLGRDINDTSWATTPN